MKKLLLAFMLLASIKSSSQEVIKSADMTHSNIVFTDTSVLPPFNILNGGLMCMCGSPVVGTDIGAKKGTVPKSNGQKYDGASNALWVKSSDTTILKIPKGGLLGDNYIKRLSFYSNYKLTASIENNSDTLVVLDSVLLIYGYRIRYIKIKDKVYPLK